MYCRRADYAGDGFDNAGELAVPETFAARHALAAERNGYRRAFRKILNADADRQRDGTSQRCGGQIIRHRSEGDADRQPFRNIVQRDRQHQQNTAPPGGGDPSAFSIGSPR